MALTANFLRVLRKSRGLTLQQVAEKVGTTNQHVSFHENGRRKLNWDWIQRYANALECHPSDITNGPGAEVRAENDEERTLLEKFRNLSEPEKKAMLQMSDALHTLDQKRIKP